MRVAVHEYAKGGHTVFETSDDGGDYVGEWDGKRQVGERICAYIDVGCDNSEGGYKRLIDALSWLTEEIKKRKLSPKRAAVSRR